MNGGNRSTAPPGLCLVLENIRFLFSQLYRSRFHAVVGLLGRGRWGNNRELGKFSKILSRAKKISCLTPPMLPPDTQEVVA